MTRLRWLLTAEIHLFPRRGRTASPLADSGADGVRYETHGLRAVISAWARGLASGLFWQSASGAGVLPSERVSRGPFGSPGRRAARRIARWARAAVRAAQSPLGTFTAITVNDRSIRVLVARGNRVLHWSDADLPPGVVEDGAVVDARRFRRAVESVVTSLHEGSRTRRRKTGLVISGRNMVQGRFVVLDSDDRDFDRTVLALASERMSITPSEVQIDWHAGPLEPPADDPVLPAGAGPEDEDGPPAETVEVYALAVFNNVLDAGLRPVRAAGMRPIEAAPKALALAVAANVASAVVVDIEHDIISVVVLRDGLPEVVRDMRVEPGGSPTAWNRAVTAHVERAVEFHDMLNPQATVGPETPVFVTGRGTDAQRVTDALRERHYNLASFPAALRAPEGFPFAEFAGSAGLAAARGRRFWQRPHAHQNARPADARSLNMPLDRPRFRFLPPEYEPRTLPLRPVAVGAAAAALIIGLSVSYGQVQGVDREIVSARRQLGLLELQLTKRDGAFRDAVRAETQVAAARSRAEAALAASEAIRGRDAGFARTLDEIVLQTPGGVTLNEVDDDGGLVTVRASAADYGLLLDFTSNLEAAPVITSVRIKSISDERAARPESVNLPPELLSPELFPPGSAFPVPGFTGPDPGVAEPGPSSTGSLPSLELELTR